MNLRDTLERLFWTVVAAALTNLGSVGILDIVAWKAAALAGINGAVTFVLVVARQRLAVLPNPGDGLPGLPTDDSGQAWIESLVRVVLALVIIAFAYWLLRDLLLDVR